MPVVTEKYEFEYLGTTIIEQFLNFLIIGITGEGSKNVVFRSNHAPQMSSVF